MPRRNSARPCRSSTPSSGCGTAAGAGTGSGRAAGIGCGTAGGTGAGWGSGGGWNDATPGAYPDWLQIDFNGAKTIDEVGDVPVQQVVIGSCTNGRLEDMALAAKILKGRKVHDDVRAIIIPATQQIYKDCIKNGYIDTFIDAGCVVSTPTCGPCLGGHMGILAAGERCVATTNRNFVGRMGHVKSEVYLASPAVAAASAVTGKISGPDEL